MFHKAVLWKKTLKIKQSLRMVDNVERAKTQNALWKLLFFSENRTM
jgi:hypothetical protein